MSYKKPNYTIRTSKHIERKIFVETLQCLNSKDYNIADYHYVGFGSYFYVDFILFNRLLSIKKMTCLEKYKDLENRMKFNKPFKFVDLKMEDFSCYVSTLRSDKKYLIWIDYEESLNKDILTSIESLVNTLKNGSIFIITVNAELVDVRSLIKTSDKESIKKIEEIDSQIRENLLSKYKEELDPYSGTIEESDVTPGGLPDLFTRTIKAVIDDSLIGRQEDSFYQLFNYFYKDGVRMLTIGGIIDKAGKEKQLKSALKNLDYINYNDKPMKISVPPLTLRERLYLDKKIPKNKNNPKKIPFKLERKELEDYIKFYKHYPNFYEVFIG